ncbi:hypothetical protein [Photobacterium leiognathi]|nr:hypothetical protein [Photobacterium leiognathi]
MVKDIMLNKNKITSYMIVVSVVFLFFFDIRPYFLWSTNLFFIKFFSCFFILSVIINNKLNLSIKNIVSLFIFILISCLYAISSNGIDTVSLSFILVVCLYILIPDSTKQKIFIAISNIYILFSTISLFTFFYVYITDSQSFSLIEPLNSVKTLPYRNYFFLVTPSEFGLRDFRFSGVFDEPGVVGTLSALFLANDKIYNNKYKRVILILSGLVSMSLAFYILIIVLFFFKNYKVILITFLSIVLLFPVIKSIGDGNIIFERFVIQRIDNLFTSTEKVNNRQSSQFEVVYNDFFNADQFYLGNGIGQASLIDPEGFSYTHTIYDNGLLFFILVNFYIGYCLFVGRLTLKQSLKCFVLLSLALLQRPYYTNICMYVILFGYVSDTDELSEK